MAGYSRPLGAGAFSGSILGLGLVALAPLTLFVLMRQGHLAWPVLDGYIGHILFFTAWQALASTVLACLGGTILARALARQVEFPGRRLSLRVMALPVAMPSLIGLYGLIAIYGQQGPIAALWRDLGLGERFPLYGWVGLLLGHVFFNLPLVVALLLPAWRDLPVESWRLAAQLGLDGRAHWRLIEWPLVKDRLPGIAILVFQLCFTSFVVALLLGGGPAATTLELAIYQALRFSFDLPLAATLAALQIFCCAAASFLIWRRRQEMPIEPMLRRQSWRADGQSSFARMSDGAIIIIGGLFVGAPILALLRDGIGAWLGDYPWSELPRAIATSLGLGLATGGLATGLGYLLARAELAAETRRLSGLANLLRLAGEIGLFLSPMALGAALIALAAGRIDLARLALGGILILTTILALPYAVSIWRPALRRAAAAHDRLALSLGLAGRQRWRIDRPILEPAMRRAFAFAGAVAIGDLTAIALFGNPDLVTLPLLLYRQISAYRLEAAGGTALCLLLLIVVLFRAAQGREVAHGPA